LTTSINTMGLECLRFWRGREKNLAVVVSIPRWPDSYRQCTLDTGSQKCLVTKGYELTQKNIHLHPIAPAMNVARGIRLNRHLLQAIECERRFFVVLQRPEGDIKTSRSHLIRCLLLPGVSASLPRNVPTFELSSMAAIELGLE
jgi:hypothetical protein